MVDTGAGAANTTARRLDVVIVGAGFGGLCAVHKFREMGLDIQAFEAGGDVGGVWYWNRYPGARVDLPSIDYCFSFSPEIEQEWTWSEEFAAQPELLAYMNFVADRLDLRKHYKFNTRVSRAIWDEQRRLWQVFTENGEVYEATYCIMATGPLSVPRDPDIPGLSHFKGTLLRAARWPHEPVDFTGKRVGVIGTGSTGIQIVQEVGPEAGELFVFQRTPSFSMPMRNQKLEPDYVAEVKRHYPGLRAAALNSAVGGLRPQSTRAFFSVTPAQRRALLEDAWKQGGLTILGTFSDLLTNPEANEHVAEFLREKIGEIVEDKATAEKLKPRGYPVFARRPCLDSSYYETYNLPHVHLLDCVEDPIEEITEKGVRLRSGEVELDMLILATGYDGLTGALTAFDVVGRNGLSVRDKWRDGAHSYLGLLIAGFPNLFMTTGPNGPAALANIVRISENDVNWIASAMNFMEKHGLATIEVTQEAEGRWMDIVYDLAQRSLLTKAKTWYVGANVAGKAQGLSLFTGGFPKYAEYCAAAARANYQDCTFEPLEKQAVA
ncbi:flavin-containing monooxygenase [Oryzicola mucosus]|uniref:NAD(P)/FAD-dependent oxidoreductase n=1 Tax=Oryzicola mucosus TaxID=2767425 RepID=A0A8J6PW57_9HYPH|nr:NAD(P)/FAD-dependent oxidoreductase [Oryzicola mucosus]MBD0415178.1 NAD(P)/FAD-dependent oxidoreductase [Oryzicola mucosus]